MTQPVISTRRLTLRVPVEADLADWAALDADERATEFIGGRRDRAQAWQGLATAAGMWALRGCGLFSVFEQDTWRWVGRVGPWLPEGHLGTEVGWAISPLFWGRGYATEAAEAAVGWAFEELGWAQVIHCIDETNIASVAVATRLGARRLRSDLEAGKPVEVYGQGSDDWRSRTAA